MSNLPIIYRCFVGIYRFHQWHKSLLHEAVPPFIQKWESKLKVKSTGYFLQRMKTKCGRSSSDASSRIVCVRDLAHANCFDEDCLHTMYADKPMEGHGPKMSNDELTELRHLDFNGVRGDGPNQGAESFTDRSKTAVIKSGTALRTRFSPVVFLTVPRMARHSR